MGGHLKAKMMYYHIYLYYGNKYNYHCVITQTLQNGQILGQFFELLYMQPVKAKRGEEQHVCIEQVWGANLQRIVPFI